MTSEEIISKAERLVAAGSVDEARELLLKLGFSERLDARVQDAFYALIPMSEALITRLPKLITQLRNPHPDNRLKAVKGVAREALKETSTQRQEWLNDPRMTTPLLELLEDPDPEIAEQAVIAIAQITRRYFRDLRALPSVLRLTRSRRQLTRFWAVNAAGYLGGAASLDDLLPLLSDRAAKIRAEVIRVVIRLAMENELKSPAIQQLKMRLVHALHDEDQTVRGRAASALRYIGDNSVLRDLKSALEVEADELAKEQMETVINEISKRS